MPRVTHVKKARKDQSEEIKKGDSYYHWKFRFGTKQVSKTYPKPWQLTQSPFLQTLYQIQDTISNMQVDSIEDLESQRDEIRDEIQELCDTTQEAFDNIPEQLQEAPTGELLQERIDALETWINELDCIDMDLEINELSPLDEDASEEEQEERKEEIEKLEQDGLDEKLDELQGIEYEDVG